jgi:bile acid:Na+ symporter, BASS family
MHVLARLFPLWLVLAGGAALLVPGLFLWFVELRLITPALALIMLAMGMTLEVADFRRVAERPAPILLALLLQYTVMPACGRAVADLFALPDPLAAGLILVCCCPGGTASNVIAYLARADVPLSVSMTALSTLAAPIATPALATWLIGGRVAVDGWGLVRDALVVVLLPVALGVGVRRLAPRLAGAAGTHGAALASLLIVLIVAAILAANRTALLTAGLPLLVGVFAAHGLGFLSGYALGRAAMPPRAARTISIEVGMQNSGLGVVLARGNFADPLVAVPCALSSVVHSLIGSGCAAVWGRDRAGRG